MGPFEFLVLEETEGQATVTFHRPPLNVMHIPMLRELNLVLEEVLGNPELALLVLRGRGKAFSAGVDVADHTPDKVREMIQQFHCACRKLAAADALTLAAVHGPALGGGCELAALCDVVLASDAARLGTPEVQIAAFPPVAACIFPPLLGLRKAIELIALGTVVDANEAHRIGLVNQVFPAAEFEAGVARCVEAVRRLSRPVVRLAKRATVMHARQPFFTRLEQVERLYLEQLMRLGDAQEGTRAFLEKRPPQWKHG